MTWYQEWFGAEYLERTRPFRSTDCPRFVDKLPANWLNVGLIRLALPNAKIVDARSTDEYCGDADTANRNGMIPGAIHLEWTETLDPKTNRFKSATALSALLRERKLDVHKPVVAS